MSKRSHVGDDDKPELRSKQLVLLRETAQELAAAESWVEIKSVRNKAEALRAFVKSIGLGLDLQNQAAELKLRAERKAGRFLAAALRHGGNRKADRPDATLKLADLKVHRTESARWQCEAAVPDSEFERYLAEANAESKEISSAGLRRRARKLGLNGRPFGAIRARSMARVTRPRESRPSPPSNGEIHHEITASARQESAIETTNHLDHLKQLVAPVCSNAGVALSATEYSYVTRLYAQIGGLLKNLAR